MQQALRDIQQTPGGVAIVPAEAYRNSTVANTIKRDGRPRLIIWPDMSSTNFEPQLAIRHFPPPSHKHESEHGWPPAKWWKGS